MEPMIAKTTTLDELFNHAPFTKQPSFLAQPKIQGIRGIWEPSEGKLFTKQGNEITILEHIVDALKEHAPQKFALDGELYSNILDFAELQEIVQKKTTLPDNSFLKKALLFKLKSIKYFVFDIIMEEKTTINRSAFILNNLHETKEIVLVPSNLIRGKEVALSFYCKCLKNGYEGVVFRQTSSLYGGKNGLLKIKPLNSMICAFVNWQHDSNLLLKTPEGETFICGGLDSHTKIIFGKYHVGTQVPIRYERLNRKGIPILARVDNDAVKREIAQKGKQND